MQHLFSVIRNRKEKSSSLRKNMADLLDSSYGGQIAINITADKTAHNAIKVYLWSI